MPPFIAMRPKSDRGRQILDTFEKQYDRTPSEVVRKDGTRRYLVYTPDPQVHGFVPWLDSVDPEWRNHLERWEEG